MKSLKHRQMLFCAYSQHVIVSPSFLLTGVALLIRKCLHKIWFLCIFV